MSERFAAPAQDTIPLRVLSPGEVEGWRATLSGFELAQIDAHGFSGKLGEVRILFDAKGRVASGVVGFGTPKDRARQQYPLGGVAARLPAGTYALSEGIAGADLENAALAWLLSAYRFTRYKDASAQGARLVAPEGLDAARLEAEAAAVALTSDLVNTPANEMGPEALEYAALDLAERFAAPVSVIRGADLLARDLPMIHTVGRAAAQEPRLIDFSWGDPSHPRVTLVGKGVCFDTGGLNLKPGSSMGLMKKDMGGAATVLGLAQLIMGLKLPVRLRVLIPAVENSVSGPSFRPGDVLRARNGLTVEINNTDAEGRLILADALALACEEKPEILVSMATLTGAARVALGPDVPPFFTDDEAVATDLAGASVRRWDPLWRLPFWNPYEEMIEPDIADLDNAPKGGFAGAITAALFLRRFTEGAGAYVHVDCYAWTPTAKPGRPKGGASQGARALFDMLSRRYAA
ncbi:leucyl aminopeptidase family protein [Halovulum dunhuangense]|uniref:Leucyl aminopeptidase family protein n=1 Tax=Halovulum dunhuangense TaxID=1505036 RepID=A0A849L049_9RHOB|nr:leucyl aminopeptidase family protein [Halovulum dunhuangense]NNU79170.1 leucyl aminopeptidase family protein [Halovulum dunhuangense]